MPTPILIADQIRKYEELGEPVNVSLSNELVHLLSDQLYQSPIKAIEELVVNSYDADASVCRVFVPSPDDADLNYVIVFDDGIGMVQNPAKSHTESGACRTVNEGKESTGIGIVPQVFGMERTALSFR